MLDNRPQILDGSRAWSSAQAAFAGTPALAATYILVDTSWYSTELSPFEGAFCLVDSSGPLTDLIGKTVQVTHRGQKIYVYCVGRAGLATNFALQRAAFFRLHDLANDEIFVNIAVL